MGVRRFAPLMMLLAAYGVRAQGELLPASNPVAGTSQVEWSRLWWIWAASFDDSTSPVADRTGDMCHLKQEGAVWFLAGTYGTRRTVRTCTMPAGKHVFFPLLNYLSYKSPAQPWTCDELRSSVAGATEDVTSLILEVDGKRVRGLEAHRLATGCFDLYQGDCDCKGLAAANGFYVMLEPLAPGTHTLNFGGRTPNMSQAVTYTLYVK